MHPLGKFTWNPLAIALIGLMSMIVILAVPLTIVEYTDGTDETKFYSDYSGTEGIPTLKTVEPMLAGSIIMMISGLTLMLVSWLPVAKNVARFVGWSFGTIAGIGALLQLTPSMMFFGDGMASVVSSWVGLEGVVTWMIGPVIASLGAMGALYVVFDFIPKLTPTEYNARELSAGLGRYQTLIAGTLALGLFVPWSTIDPHMAGWDGLEFKSAGYHFGDGSMAGMQSFLQLFIAATWIGVLSIWIMQFALLVQGTALQTPLGSIWHMLNLVNAAMFGGVAVYYLMTVTWLFHPDWGNATYENFTYTPGWFNLALIPLLVFWGMNAIRDALGTIEEMRSGDFLPSDDLLGS